MAIAMKTAADPMSFARPDSSWYSLPTRSTVASMALLAMSAHMRRSRGRASRSLASSPDLSRLTGLLNSLKPLSMLGLLATVVLLFGFQAETILAEPVAIVLSAIPLLIQTYGIFAIAYGAAKYLRLPHNIAAPACMIGTSNFFELAVAVAISLFGLQSGAALATVVGVLVEVPVMLSLVAIANRTRHWFPGTAQAE